MTTKDKEISAIFVKKSAMDAKLSLISVGTS